MEERLGEVVGVGEELYKQSAPVDGDATRYNASSTPSQLEVEGDAKQSPAAQYGGGV